MEWKFYNKNDCAESELKNGNGKIKTYYWDSCQLAFEGEYVKGKKSGKCKEYNSNGNLEFEGEYVNGEKSGKCKEYYDCGKLKFDGIYLNGKKHGKCKEYNSNGKLDFEGEYVNGKKSGKYHFISLIKKLQTELSKVYSNKKEKKFSFEFELRGTKEDLKGATLEISSIKKTKPNLDLIENNLHFITLDLEVKDESFIPSLQSLFGFFLITKCLSFRIFHLN